MLKHILNFFNYILKRKNLSNILLSQQTNKNVVLFLKDFSWKKKGVKTFVKGLSARFCHISLRSSVCISRI